MQAEARSTLGPLGALYKGLGFRGLGFRGLGCRGLGFRVYGWLSKLRSLFGYPKYQAQYYTRDPKRDHNFDNHPYI